MSRGLELFRFEERAAIEALDELSVVVLCNQPSAEVLARGGRRGFDRTLHGMGDYNTAGRNKREGPC
jgi:hypothetical protein